MSPHDPAALAAHYTHFDVTGRTLLTGHSHQAWPDVGLAAQQQAWLDAAAHVDDKWSHAFEQAKRVKLGFARLLGDASASQYVLAGSTHDLLVRFLSGLPLAERPKIVTTDGEFHTMRRQLTRLEEEAIQVVRVPVDPCDTLAERVAAAVDEHTAAVMMSSVMFKDAAILRGLDAVAARCGMVGASCLIDAYHAVNVVPFDLATLGLETCFVVGGGYKYCQLGEGNCFMRVPEGCEMRPVVTGWYAEFSELAGETTGTPYPQDAARFAGSTYDPTSHYRGAAVFDFFAEQGLTDATLRAISQHQVGLLIREFDRADLDPACIARPDRPLEQTAGFLSLTTPYARELQTELKDRGIWTDYRESQLRLGPAPYVTDDQLRRAISALEACVGERQP